ncbi:MAG: TIGR03960 family B12-binding radical SAM protein [Candidatus Omnitrophota bacterium]
MSIKPGQYFNLSNMLDDILLNIQKPARYIGQEWNTPKKDFISSPIKFALCFPDLYEVGMSNLGLRILYGVLNSMPEVSCERFFSPASDLEQALLARGQEISSLETGRPLKEFDLVGFSLGYELNFTNVLGILKLAGLPLLSSLRDHRHPLIIAGGPCVLNPEPMHEFFDLFVIGEAEEVICEIIDLYSHSKDGFRSNKISKEELLLGLSGIEGVYVPSLYEVIYDDRGLIKEFRPRLKGVAQRVKKRFVRELDNSYFPQEWLLPYIQVIHDRITLEIMRGCPNSCRFCQARLQYFPYRLRSRDKILELAGNTYKNSGYEELALGGLSVSDYPGIEVLLGNLIGLFRDKGVAVSLPSIKPKIIVGSLSSMIATIKKTGLTFAPEAATERLRKILNKRFDMQEFMGTLEQAYSAGYQRVKLYFMIGLPFEEDADLGAIVDFAKQVSELRRKSKHGPAQVNISINTLIPKPHTPFQWLKMQDLESIKRKHSYIKGQIKSARLELNLHNPQMSILEGLLCRGDRRLSKVILAAFLKGARFDAWVDHFNFQSWMDAFSECGIDPQRYLRERQKEEILPWDFLDIGITKDNLLSDSQ